MTTVRCGENESVESALKRFKRKCQKDGIIGDLKKKQEYVKPSVAKKKNKKQLVNVQQKNQDIKKQTASSLVVFSCY